MFRDFFNRKKFYNVLLQAVCDSERFFWNVCVGEPGGVHDVAQFTSFKLYTQLRRRDILFNDVLEIIKIEVRPYLSGDSAYPRRPYLRKNYKTSVQ